MGNIFVTSDMHFNHDKEFIYRPRNVSSIEEMNEKIVTNWNNVVGDNDDVYVLGDLMLGGIEDGMEMVGRLRGKLHVIRGNHDTDARIAAYHRMKNIVEVVDAKFFKYHNYSFFMSHYPALTSNYDDDKPLKARAINLCGHRHTTNPFEDADKGLIYHCEMDAHDCTPVSIEQIITDIKEKMNEQSF